MVVELHLLQNFAPSCLNRDDTNAPKDCLFGGVRRARLSSQCLKRAIRWHPAFLAATSEAVGVRTKRVLEQVCDDLTARGLPATLVMDMALPVVQDLVGQLGPQGRTRALVYLGRDEMQRIADLIADHWGELADACEARGAAKTRRRDPLQQLASTLAARVEIGTMAPDVALFGRMIAENAHFNVDAACQVAHALSTHRAVMEVDFFSAVDDLKPATGTGAEMMGTTEFSSACFYRYAAVSVDQLLANLRQDTEAAAETLCGFLQAAVVAVPAGRQSGMAAANPPSFMMVVVRSSATCWSLVNAFEQPVTVAPNERRGLVAKSIVALDDYWGRLAQAYGEDGIEARPACWLDDCPVRYLGEQRVQRVQEMLETAVQATGLGGGARP